MAQLRIFQAEIVGNHVEIVFELNMKTFCLSVAPMRKNASSHVYFTQTCNSLVQLALQANAGNWHFSRGQSQIHDTLSRLSKDELLALCHGMPKMPHFCHVQLYLSHEPRRCELQQNESGDPVLRLTTGHVLDADAQALDREDQHFSSLYASADICNFSANEVSVTSSTSISTARICGEVVHGMDSAVYHCIAARDAGARGARRWACPQRRQLIARQTLQAACAADPDDTECIRVPALLAYLHDDEDEDEESDGVTADVRLSRIMGGLYQPIDGVPLRVFLGAARRGEPKVREVATQVTGMMSGLHRHGLVWGGESEEAEAETETETMLMDCLMVDGQGHPWLVDGFGAGYHQDAVQSDDKALIALLNQMKMYFPESAEASGDAEAGGWSNDYEE